MPLDFTAALNTYGFVGTLANAVPELRAKFEQAAREEWPPERFSREIQDTGWWRSNADTARQLFTLQATDPATYAQNLANAEHKVWLAALQMGRQVDARALGLQALMGNWDDQQLRAHIGAQGGYLTGENGQNTGDAGQMQSHLKSVAAAYGVPVTDDWVGHAMNMIQSGRDTVEGYENVLQARAKASYPQFAEQITAGMTVRDIADPWISTMANTLEIADTDIDLTDPHIRRALTQRNPDGSATSQPLWAFERQLKDDPRYDKTKQARTEAYEMLQQVGRDFGFAS